MTYAEKQNMTENQSNQNTVLHQQQAEPCEELMIEALHFVRK